MNLTLWLASLPLWLSALIVVGMPTSLAMLGSAWVRHRVTLEKLTANNEVAGFKFAVLGVIYAVLLGFVIIIVWGKFHDAEVAVSNEAGTAAALYRLSDGLAADKGKALRAELSVYIRSAIDSDLPALANGAASPNSTQEITNLYKTVMTNQPTDGRGDALFSEMLRQLDAITQARRDCVVLAEGVVPGVIWSVLLIGGCAMLGFTFFFGTHHLSAQVLMTGLLALVVFMGFLVILSVNHPFTGPVSVGFEPLQKVLVDFGG